MRGALIQTVSHPTAGPRWLHWGWAELHLLTLTVIPASREVAEPFLELSVGLDSLHMRLARLLAARDSDNMSSEDGGRAVGKGNMKGRSPWLPSPKPAVPLLHTLSRKQKVSEKSARDF